MKAFRLPNGVEITPLPRSTATNVYDLLDDVKVVMREEPKRVDLNTFRSPRASWRGGPACGMVGCVGGWASILAGGPSRDIDNMSTVNHAQRLLTGGGLQTWFTLDGVRTLIIGSDGLDIKGRPGTTAYVESAIRRIETFQRINKKKLKRRKIVIPQYVAWPAMGRGR